MLYNRGVNGHHGRQDGHKRVTGNRGPEEAALPTAPGRACPREASGGNRPPQHPAARLHLGSGVFTARGRPQRNAWARMVSILGWRGVGVFLVFFFSPLPLLVAV